jgi:hypothetical protein
MILTHEYIERITDNMKLTDKAQRPCIFVIECGKNITHAYIKVESTIGSKNAMAAKTFSQIARLFCGFIISLLFAERLCA